MTYQPKTYRKLGGDEFVVASGGKITAESGSTVNIASGASLKIGGSVKVNTGAVVSTTGGGRIKPKITLASTAAAISAVSGMVEVSSTNSTGVGAYGLAAPSAAGIELFIYCKSSTGGVTVTSTAPTIHVGNSTAGGTVLTFTKASDSVILRSISTTKWLGIRSSTALKCT